MSRLFHRDQPDQPYVLLSDGGQHWHMRLSALPRRLRHLVQRTPLHKLHRRLLH
jgi:hypothetical protein